MDEDFLAKQRIRARQLLGLREFDQRKPEDFLKSPQRRAAWAEIRTNTLPTTKADMKRGVVLESVDRGLLPEKLFQTHPVVYIGSGVDIEYPLALGARKIVLVDPIFSSNDAVQEVVRKIEGMTQGSVTVSGADAHFTFDFGSGVQPASVSFVAEAYELINAERLLPQDCGAIILFASQGPQGIVNVDDTMKKKLAPGGVILSDTDLITIDAKGESQTTSLGR